MRAAVHAGIGEIRLETRPAPRIGPGELLLRVLGCGLCGSDLAKLRAPATRPAVLGHEIVGEVAEAGDGAGSFRLGERVVVAHHVPCGTCHYCRRGSVSMCRAFKASSVDPGGFAEYVRVPAENVRQVTFRVPAGMADSVASFTEPLGCCVRAIRRAAVAAGDTVAVAGLGAMGCLLLQLARQRGARVVGVDPIPGRRALAESLGAETAVAPEEAAAAIAGPSEGRGADVVVLAAAAPALVRTAFDWVRDGGAVHLFVGEGEAPVPVGELYKRELTLTATYSSSPADLTEAFDLLRQGAIRVDALCSHRVPLERLADAVDLMERREALKVFVEVGA
jgi:L-iditol 2-dehydrogenase